MILRRHILFTCLAAALLVACQPVITPQEPQEEEPQEDVPEPEELPIDPVDIVMEYPEACGIAYLYDGSVLPEMHVSVSLEEWNKLLSNYDENKRNKKYVLCDVRYVRDGEETVIHEAALRLRGQTSRRRPEGSSGKPHTANSTDWHRCHFQINFRKIHKDDAHEIHGARKVLLKYFNGDAAYVRELFCFDLFRRAGVWTGEHAAYCRMFIHVEGDNKEAYYGIYTMLEPVDERFLKVREAQFGSKDGYLWKCRIGAGLNNSSNVIFGPDNEDGLEYTYELKTEIDSYAAAETVLKDFIRNLNSLSGQAFRDWIDKVCDVPFLLKTYAVNVAVGMWDDYWNNSNNYYIYFSPDGKGGYKFFFIPFDYDNTLGTSLNCGVQMDAGWQSPLHWGVDSNPLIFKILQFDDYRQIYCNELLRIVDPGIKLMYYEYSHERIDHWHSMIEGLTKNDTGEGSTIQDKPASWGSRSGYRILDPEANVNFFKLKAQSINKYCK